MEQIKSVKIDVDENRYDFLTKAATAILTELGQK